MTPTPNLIRLIEKAQAKIRKQKKLVQETLLASIFFLLFGFMCGNLFGTFLNFFRNYIHWDGGIIALTILFVEFINYLNFGLLKENTTQANWQPSAKKEQSRFQQILSRFQTWIKNIFYNTTTPRRLTNQQDTNTFGPIYENLKPPFVLFIRFLNFYKLGLLLGFFIDAFKVGS